ncbi:hypothetical protein [Endozoicomonas sp. SESOKO1]|uniref:hypothetical protein n=1 Tax=Endozoicomonas sp. SESOKO1 TaxID=2828742 RepID=UPI002147BF86|nr:hypothetical protein [Endozoicomonas sp. SESOKO1]
MASIADIAASAGHLFIEAIKAPFRLIGYFCGRVVKAVSSVFNYLSGQSGNVEQSQADNKAISSRTVSADPISTGTDSTQTVSTEKIKDAVFDNLKRAFTDCLKDYLDLMKELEKKVSLIFIARNIISSNLAVNPKDISRADIDKAIKILKEVNRTLDLRFNDNFFNIPPSSQSNTQPKNAEFIKILTQFQETLDSLITTKRPDKYQLVDSIYPIQLLQQEINQLIDTNCTDKDKWLRCGEKLKEQFAFDEPYLSELCALKYVPEPGEKAPAADGGHLIYLEAQYRIVFYIIDNL